MRLSAVAILNVWRELGGPEPKRGRSRAFWRDGKNLSVSLSVERNAWYDFVDSRGGGSLDLVMTARNCDKRDALRWLELHAGLDPLHSTPEERRLHAVAKERAELSAPRIADFVNGLRIAIDRRLAIAAFFVQHGVDAPAMFACASRYAYLLDIAEPEDIVSVSRDPANRRAFAMNERIGRADREDAEAVTIQIVAMLAAAEGVEL